jgi:hypothetical protein
MVLGFNHNIMYKGEVFHVQTEDSGVEIPNIVTLLYRGGVILCSMKTSYADILKMENLEDVVEELMKEQHKTMMRRLKSGEFDERAFPSAPPPPRGEKPEDGIRSEDSGASQQPAIPVSGDEAPQADQASLPEDDARHSTPEPASDGGGASDESRNLEDAILHFFGIHET